MASNRCNGHVALATQEKESAAYVIAPVKESNPRDNARVDLTLRDPVNLMGNDCRFITGIVCGRVWVCEVIFTSAANQSISHLIDRRDVCRPVYEHGVADSLRTGCLLWIRCFYESNRRAKAMAAKPTARNRALLPGSGTRSPKNLMCEILSLALPVTGTRRESVAASSIW